VNVVLPDQLHGLGENGNLCVPVVVFVTIRRPRLFLADRDGRNHQKNEAGNRTKEKPCHIYAGTPKWTGQSLNPKFLATCKGWIKIRQVGRSADDAREIRLRP